MISKRYWRHGSPIELEKITFMEGPARRAVSVWTDPRGKEHTGWDIRPSPMRFVWRVRVAGAVVDRALTMRRARYLAEHHARAALIA